MRMLDLARHLGRYDLRRIGRDRLLVFMAFFVLLIAGALRIALPWLDQHLADRGVLPNASTTTRLRDCFPLLVGYFAVFQGSLIAGTIAGFALLDEREDNTLKAMLVTPVPFRAYTLYRVAAPMLLGFVIVVVQCLVIQQSLPSLPALLLIAAGASLTAPIVALFYATYAENKVQGFALAKFVGIAGLVIIGGWFVDGPRQWLFGAFPPFLVCRAYWMTLRGAPAWWLSLALGVVLQGALLSWLVREFHRVAHR